MATATSSSLFDSSDAVENGVDDVRLPCYCFQASSITPEPSMCVPSNAEYVKLCQEVDGLTDQFTLEMRNAGKGGITKVELNFITAEITCKTTGTSDDSDLVIGIKENLRYSFITKSNTLIISYWDKDFRGIVKNLILGSDSIEDCIKLLNCIRKMIYMREIDQSEPFRVTRFFPLMSSEIMVYQSEDLSTGMGDVADGNFNPLFVTLDEECIMVYGDNDIGETAMNVLKFSKEQNESAIERIYAHTVSKSVEIETSGLKFFFKSMDSSSEAFKVFSFYVQGRILPKLQSIFNFTDASEFNKYMSSHPLEDYSNVKPQFVPAKMPEESPQMGQNRNDTSSRTEGGEGYAASTEGAQGYTIPQSRSVTADKSKLDDLILKLETSTDTLEGLSEDTQMMWITIESDIEDKIKSGLVPESTMQSGGLDPNSSDHFEKCIDEIQDALFTTQVDKALSHMNGCEEVFLKSDNTAVVQWLTNFQVVDRLRQVYLAGTKR